MIEGLRFLNDYYDKTYVLSVQSADGRRKLFEERFKGLNYSFFFGADKKDFTTKELVEKNIYSEELASKHHRYNKLMMPGEIACAWSHRMVYEDMLEKNYSRALIFEDDAVPDADLMNQVPATLAEIPGDCEVLMWGWSKNAESGIVSFLKQTSYQIQHKFGLLKWTPTMIKNLVAKPFSSRLKKAGFHDYTLAYGVTRSGAEKLVQMQTPIQYIADNLVAHAITKNIVSGYIVYPAAILHDNLPDGTARDSYIR
jgi:glycosyl transferase, family 25